MLDGYISFRESCDGYAAFHNCDAVVAGSSERRVKNNHIMMEVKSWDLFREVVYRDLQGVLEEWSGVELLPSYVRQRGGASGLKK